MDITSKNAHVYIGRNAGQPVLEAMMNTRQGGSIDVLSPYLTPKYVKFLVDKAKEGVEVNLVTSEEYARPADKAQIARMLVEQKREQIHGAYAKIKRFRVYGLALLALAAAAGYAAYAVTPKIPGTLIFVGVCVLGAFFMLKEAGHVRLYTYSYHPRISFAVYRGYNGQFCPEGFLMHAKAFVINQNVAFVGSLNLTEAGFSYNLETRTDMQDYQAAQELSSGIRGMIAAPWAPIRTPGEIGKDVYFEPAR